MSSLLELPTELLPLQGLLAHALQRVEHVFDQQLRSDIPVVNRLCEHVERYRGKMLRPTLVMLSALAASPKGAQPALDAAGGEGDPADSSLITDSHIAVAAVCEMIHMATLVHDDVLDEADVRRRGATVNRLHGNEAAVILGDYLISAAFNLSSSIPGEAGRETSLLIARTGMTLCAGELLQLDRRGDFSIDESMYFEIVDRKTASLIAAACRLGARLTPGAAPAVADAMDSIGRKLGVAFQIQDDLLDLTGVQEVVGKSLGKDVVLGKLTLPVIHHLASASPMQRGRTLSLVSDSGEAKASHADQLRAALESTDSLTYARKAAETLVDESKRLIDALPPTLARGCLFAMADAVVNRAF